MLAWLEVNIVLSGDGDDYGDDVAAAGDGGCDDDDI